MKINNLLFSIIIFLSSALLFSSELIFCKSILPIFGGVSSVWSISMVFFTFMLFFGYLYSHLLCTYFSDLLQLLIHSILIAISLKFTDIIPVKELIDLNILSPQKTLLLLLFNKMGLSFFILSSSAPLYQSWYARVNTGKSPYKLYALSNFASLLILIIYPFYIEVSATVPVQGLWWSRFYILFVILNFLNIMFVYKRLNENIVINKISEEIIIDSAVKLKFSSYFKWFIYSFTSTILFLGTTNKITQDIGVIPFLWILPLFIYLFSFVLTFRTETREINKYHVYTATVALPIICFNLTMNIKTYLSVQIFVYLVALFVFCMVCNNFLFKEKPHFSKLTDYFLTISFGGAIGSIFTGLLSPLIFNDFFELHTGLLIFCLLLLISYIQGVNRYIRKRKISLTLAYFFVPFFLVILTGIFLINDPAHIRVLTDRNFYGILRIYDEYIDEKLDKRIFFSNNTIHGFESLKKDDTITPNAYYGDTSGVGLVFRELEKKERINYGVVGLGAGTLAAYGRKNDTVDFFEINPDVVNIAKKYFRFLSSTSSEVNIFTGDGRISLEKLNSRNYDLLILDAFSGDGIPVHLITCDAFRMYLKHMKQDGYIAVNISNKYIDLKNVIKKIVDTLKLSSVFIVTEADLKIGQCRSEWIIISNRENIENNLKFQKRKSNFKIIPDFPLWTDNYNNLFSVLK